MYFKRKQQEKTSSVTAHRNSSELNISHRRKKHRVSQDVLAFKMQSKINSKNDVSNACNVRLVNLGRGRTLPPVKNGVNVAGNRRVDSVYLPLSPIETPSALDLSYSPNGGVLGNPSYKSEARANKTTNIPYFGSRDSNCSSSVIDLFGVPVEKPVRTHKLVTSDESKHKYCVNSDRVCRKTSCSMLTDSMMPVAAEKNLPKDHCANRSNTFSSDHHQTFQFTRPDILGQNSLKHMPSIIGSDNETCFSDPLMNYSSSRPAVETWCNISDTGCNICQDGSYTPTLVSIPSMKQVPNLGSIADRDSSLFEVNLVNSPQRQEHAGNTLIVPTNINREHRPFRSAYPAEGCGFHDSGSSVRNDIFDHPVYSDVLLPNDTEFYAEVPDKIEDMAVISSPRSPPKPVFLPYNKHGYSPLDNCDIFDQPCVYARQEDNRSAGKHTRGGQFYQGNHKPVHVWNQDRHAIDLYERQFNSNTDRQTYSGNNMSYAYTCNENHLNCNSDHNIASNTCSKEHQAIPRKESFIISCGMDCASNVGLTSHARDNGCSHASSFSWRQALPGDVQETGNARRKISTTSTLGNNTENTSVLSKPPDLNIQVKPSLTIGQRVASCDSHMLMPSTEDMYQEVHKTVTMTNKQTTNSLPDARLLSVPLMTSTPCCQQNGQQVSQQPSSPESVRSRTSSPRRDKQAVSTSRVLLEMSMLEKQQVQQEDASSSPSLASYTREQDYRPSHHGVMHTYSPDSTVNNGTNMTPFVMHEQMGGTSLLPTTNSIQHSTNNFKTSQRSDNSLLNTPVSSDHAQERSEQSQDLLSARQSTAVQHKETYPNNFVQNRETCQKSSDVHCSENSNGKVSAQMPSEKSIEVCTPRTKTDDNKEQKMSVASQTTPKSVKDASCSPIQEMTQDKLQTELQAAGSTDAHNKVYCLRSRNKIGQPDIVKDTD